MQENRAKFNQYAISACYLLCGIGAETRTRFISERPRLGCTRARFMNDLKVILTRTNPIGLMNDLKVILTRTNPIGLAGNYLSVSEQLVELLLWSAGPTVYRQRHGVEY